jgi:predicted DNA-binding protein (MmcQ/YjbR family)
VVGVDDTIFERVQVLALDLPEAVRVDVEGWGGQPTFRVRGKNFVFTHEDRAVITVKLPMEEAAAVVATDERASPTGYGLGKHGWVSIDLSAADEDLWVAVDEWIITSYLLVAPRALARAVEAGETAHADDGTQSR